MIASTTPTPREPGVLVLGGPTASGKTPFAIELAQRYGAEIIGADSRQVYRDMAIGTAAPSDEQRARVAHHLIGFVDPYERYSAARFICDAAATIDMLHARGKRALVVGGTGFYLRALCGEVELGVLPPLDIRARVRREVALHPLDVLHAWLAARDAPRAATIAVHDTYRITRALELDLSRRSQASAAGANGGVRTLPTLRASHIPYVKLVLRADPQSLARRITQRTGEMLAAGLIAEAVRIGPSAVAADAVGYREALAFAAGWSTASELRGLLERATRRYAKRQRTWFRGEPNVHWVDLGDVEAVDRAVRDIGWQ